MNSARHILVVDDEATDRLMMRAALRKEGFEVTLAANGRDALQQFGQQHFDLVMLDVDMGDMSGLEVCAALRESAGDLLPIVMVTGMDDLESVGRAYEAGATDFIAKPVNRALIGYRVRYLLRAYQALLDLRLADARNAAILGAIPDLLFELDLDGRYIDYHAPRAELLAAPEGSFLGKTVFDILPAAAAQSCMAALHAAHQHGTSTGEQFELDLPQGRSWFELSVSRKMAVDGQTPHFIVLSRDITERKQAESQIARLAYFDSLTGLPNRQSFLARIEREVQRAKVSPCRFAVLFMDLDGFKGINDTMGHGAGDRVLQLAADRLLEGVRPTDLVSRPFTAGSEVELARLGGDEFTALMLGVESAEVAMSAAHRIGELMRRPFVVDGRTVNLTTSVGIALYPQDGQDGLSLLKHADTAMYHAKASGRDNAKLYSTSLTEAAQRRMELDVGLRAALRREEFHLVYQPQVNVATGRADAVEALIRWVHPTRGVVSPLDFIPLAESNGLIDDIGRWVLVTACREAAQWNRAGRTVRVAVNLSPFQFKNPGLLASVLQVLAQTGLAPERLELEVTEASFLENAEAAIATLRALRNHGVSIALDDFGTGYSSLSYLTRMPICNLKLDRSFIGGMQDGGPNDAIVRSVLTLSGSLGMAATAEGVETLEQALLLKSLRCDFLQGFWFSRPVPAMEVPALLQRHWSLDEAPSPTAGAAAVGLAPVGALG